MRVSKVFSRIWQTVRTKLGNRLEQTNFQFTRKHALNMMMSYLVLNPVVKQMRILCDDSKPPENPSNEGEAKVQMEKLTKEFIDIDVGDFKEFKENEMIELVVRLPSGKDYPLILTKYDNKVCCICSFRDNLLFYLILAGTCVYDGETQLKNGILFGNKLYCPKHGCAYNVQSGWVEYGPAIDHLPIFYTSVQKGRVHVFVPKIPPIKVRPPLMTRDYTDLRKIVIVGAGAAAMSAAETLRLYGFTGELTIISPDTKLPINRSLLNKTFKEHNPKKLALRDEDFYKFHGINLMLGRTAVGLDNSRANPYVELEDGLRIEFDGVILATGTRPVPKPIEGDEGKENFLFLHTLEDHQKISQRLQKTKKLTILGCNLRSLETAATIRQEFPNIDITVVDENEENSIEVEYGPRIFAGLKKYRRSLKVVSVNRLHQNHGVKFLLGKGIEKFEGSETEVSKILFADESNLKCDLILGFPNHFLANTELLNNGVNTENIEFDDFGRVRVGFEMRADHKRIFAAGEAAWYQSFLNYEFGGCTGWGSSINQGMIAALNILALDIPNHIVPFWTSQHYDKVLQFTGMLPVHKEIMYWGDPENLDFMAFYNGGRGVQAACGNMSEDNRIIVANECLRLQVFPEVDEKTLPDLKMKEIADELRELNRSGCFKELIHEVRYNAKRGAVLWLRRDRTNEFYNFWEKGYELKGFVDAKTNE